MKYQIDLVEGLCRAASEVDLPYSRKIWQIGSLARDRQI